MIIKQSTVSDRGTNDYQLKACRFLKLVTEGGFEPTPKTKASHCRQNRMPIASNEKIYHLIR